MGGVAKWLPPQVAKLLQLMAGSAQPPRKAQLPIWWVPPSLLAGHMLMAQQLPSSREGCSHLGGGCIPPLACLLYHHFLHLELVH